MGKIALFSPNIKGIKGKINRVQPLHGLGLIGAVLENQGHDVYIRDTALEGYENQINVDKRTSLIGESDEDIKRYLSRINPDIVGISVVFSNLMEATHNLANLVKQVNPKIKVVVGGNHITNSASDYLYANDAENFDSNMPKDFKDLQNLNIDYAMRGECDFVFPKLVDCLLENKDPKDIKGLIYRTNKNVVINEKPEHFPLTLLPFEARDKMNMEKYFKISKFHAPFSKSNKVLSVMASRGCPEKCRFCTTPQTWGNKIRWREPQNIYDEIKQGIDEYGIEEVQFSDDSLTANRKNLEKLCHLIEPLEIHWCVPNSIKFNYQKGKTQYELFKLMKQSGCYQLSLPCENGNQRVLDDLLNKNLKVEDMAPSIDNAKKVGLEVHTHWLVGVPDETREEIENTIRVAESLNSDSYSLHILTPLPATEIYREVMKKNLWWDSNKPKDLMFSNSLIKVDGFKSPEEFENWVSEKHRYLNKR